MQSSRAGLESWVAVGRVAPPADPRRLRATGARLARVTEGDDLVSRAAQGDERAFRALFRAHRSDVTRLVHRMLGRSNDVEDVVQEAWVQVHRCIKDFRYQARFSTWLYRVTVNVVLMHRRAARSRPTLVEAPPTLVSRDRAPLPDEQVARGARLEAFTRLLERLSEKKRTVFVLHDLEGVAPTDIAEIVGAPVLTVRTRLFYARRELAAMMHEEPTLAALVAELEATGSSAATRRSESEVT